MAKSIDTSKMETAEVESLPNCDVCEYFGHTHAAQFDSFIPMWQRWGYTCSKHFREYGPALGSRSLFVTHLVIA